MSEWIVRTARAEEAAIVSQILREAADGLRRGAPAPAHEADLYGVRAAEGLDVVQRGVAHPAGEHDHRVEITSHNHNYGVKPESIDPERVRITHRSLNDDCIEGIELIGRPVYSVQYHPEAAPGPRDGQYLFERFVTDMLDHRKSSEGVA